MQVTEEDKEAIINEGDSLSSDDEDLKEEEREKFVNTFQFSKMIPENLKEIETLLICQPGTPQALSRILYYGRMKEIGIAET